MLKPLPVKAPPKPKHKSASAVPQSKAPAITANEISSNTSLYSHQTKEARHISRPTEFKLADLSQQNYPPKCEDIEPDAERPEEQNGGTPTSAAFGRLASKMKLMLRRKNTNAKKEKKKRHYEEVDRIEDVHWTEM
jgi:pyruvate dehydrogenase phosphatase